MSNFVFEIFSEELPATLQKKIAIDYKQFAEKELKGIFELIECAAKNGEFFIKYDL